MTADQYVNQILAKYQVDAATTSAPYKTAAALKSAAEQWAGQCLRSVTVSGSFAKQTAVSSTLAGGSDIDLFVSLTSNCSGTMKELYEGLYAHLTAKSWSVTRQNVSLRVTIGSVAVDFVPSRHQGGRNEDHTLYVRRGDTWKKTNVQVHLNYVLRSGFTAEIRALKIWKRLHCLEFLSFYIELFAIRSLNERRGGSLAQNVLNVLNDIAVNLNTWQIVDPANTNNIISEQHTADEKRKIMAQAAAATKAPNWNAIIW